jgi:hypothetical protein
MTDPTTKSPDVSTLPIVERLRRKVQRFPATGGGSIGIGADGKTTSSSYVTDDGYRLANPDGPEAAGTIEELIEVGNVLAGNQWFGDEQSRRDVEELINRWTALLAKVGAQ